MMAMTLNCARCHDHKIDPILQRDYYKVLAFFNNVNEPTRNAKSVLHDVVVDTATHGASSKQRAANLAEAKKHLANVVAPIRARWTGVGAGKALAGMVTAEKGKPVWH